MEQVKKLFGALSKHFDKLARANAVVARPVSVGDRHVVPLCELSLAFGGASGEGEAWLEEQKPGSKQVTTHNPSGTGGGALGAAKTKPVAVLVLEEGKVRLELMGE